MKTKWRVQRDHKTLKTQGMSARSRLMKETLRKHGIVLCKNRDKCMCRRGTNALQCRHREGPSGVQLSVRRLEGALVLGKRILTQKLHKGLNEMTSQACSWLGKEIKVYQRGNKTQWTKESPRESQVCSPICYVGFMITDKSISPRFGG